MGFVNAKTGFINKKEMKDWLKNNWPWVLVIVTAILVFFLTRSCTKMNDYKGDIKAKDELIEQMMVEYQELEEREAAKKDSIQKLVLIAEDISDSLQDTRIDYINQKKRHAKQVADLNSIPTDTLYVDVTGQLDSLSVLW